jgi:hypothetical protein
MARRKQTPIDRRLVLHHTTGPLSGLMQIVGAGSQLKPTQPPESFQITRGDSAVLFSLVRCKRRFWLYKEVAQ